MHEFGYAWRQLRKSPGFTIAAVLTLAMGIGANVAVFSVMNAVLMNPTGIPHPDGLVALRAKYTAMRDLDNISISAPDFQDSLEAKKIFVSGAVMQPGSFNYSAESMRPVRLVGARVSSQWFDVFQARPALGRTFRPEDDVPGSNNSVVLTSRLWKKQLGGDPGIVGRKLQLNGQAYEVIGVMGPEFNWPNDAELWAPLALPLARYHDQNYRFNENLFGVARLQPGVTLKQADELEEAATRQIVAQVGFAQKAGWGMFCMPLVDYIAGDLRKPLAILLAAVILVLIIACSNIAGLQLARATERQHENSVRAALGASRGRLMSQPFIESVFLAVIGVLLGVAIAHYAIPAILMLAPAYLGRNIQVQLAASVLLFAAAAAAICVILCGTAPALQIANSGFFLSLREGGRSGTSSRTSNRLRSALVVGEITVAMLLLVCSGLLFRSLRAVEQLSTGFDPHGVATATISLPKAVYDTEEKQAAFFSAMEQQLRQIPGVTSAAFVDNLPFSGDQSASSFQIKGQVVPPDSPGPHGHIDVITPDYFRTLGVELVRGRFFTDDDRKSTQPVAIVDETLARQYWPGQDVLDHHISVDEGKTWITIVGVVKHIKISSLDAEANEGFYYFPLAQSPVNAAYITVKTSGGNAPSLRDAIQSAISSIDANEPVFDFKSMDQRVEASLAGRRFVVVLLGIFAGLSLFLSALGLYAVVAYMVRMRVREIGIRMALGANHTDIAGMVLRHGMRIAVAGSVLGIIATLSAGRVLSSMLYNVSLYNPVPVLGSCFLLGSLVLLASYLPARRAVKVQPIQALRED